MSKMDRPMDFEEAFGEWKEANISKYVSKAPTWYMNDYAEKAARWGYDRAKAEMANASGFDEKASKTQGEMYQAVRTVEALKGGKVPLTAEIWVEAQRKQFEQDSQTMRAVENNLQAVENKWHQSNRERAYFERQLQAANEVINQVEENLKSAYELGRTGRDFHINDRNKVLCWIYDALELIKAYKEKK